MQKLLLVCFIIGATFLFTEAQVYGGVGVGPMGPVVPLASVSIGRRRRSPMPKPNPGILKGAAMGAVAGGAMGAIAG